MNAKHLRPTATSRKISRAVTVPVVLVAALAIGTPAFAGKPSSGGSSGSSLSVVVKSGTDSTPNYGETITFNVTSSVEKKWVELKCYQNGTFVYSASAGFFADYPWPPDYTLSSAYWTSGAADCNARLYTANSKGRQSTLATMSFTVAA